jgi:hypothetical protein
MTIIMNMDMVWITTTIMRAITPMIRWMVLSILRRQVVHSQQMPGQRVLHNLRRCLINLSLRLRGTKSG